MSKRQRCDTEVTPDVGRLLCRLKETVERALLSRHAGVGGNVWLTHGGSLDLVVSCIEDILRHGLKSRIRQDSVILEWIVQPVSSVSEWLRDTLLQFCLRDQLVQLLSNRQALEDIYTPEAFLRLSPYVESLLACLMALEEQQHKYLTEIDPALYMVPLHGKALLNDQRSRSFPVLSISSRKFTSLECCSTPSDTAQSINRTCQHATSSYNTGHCWHCVTEVVEQLICTVSSHVQDQQHVDRPSLASTSTVSMDSKLPSAGPAVLPTAGHRRTRSDDVFLRRMRLANTNRLTPTASDCASTSGNRQFHQGHIGFESIKESLVEAAKLRHYLAQREYETELELERENAHFYLSEMLIGAIEQMKWRNVLSSQWPSSTWVGRDAPTVRRPVKLDQFTSASFEGFSDSSGDNMFSSSGDLTVSWNRDVQSNTSEMDGAGECGDVAGPSTTVDTGYGTETRQSLVHDPSHNRVSSAESVAMNLLHRFSQKHFSPAQTNELKFLVSYQDVPQLLLPLPQSMPVAPDEVYAEGFKEKVKLRGTFEWAPPRPQLIFKMHPVPKLKPLLEQQSYKCAGCGMKLDKAYFKRLRYCTYLGKLFCQCCHQGQTATIPAHVLHQWDFRPLPVSDFSYRFLAQQSTAPVWNVKVVNDGLYNSVRQLRSVGRVRQQLRFCYDYVRTCRLAKELVTTNGRLAELFEKLPAHLTQEVDVYSMQDFAQVKDGTLYTKLEAALLLARYHIESCQFCRAKGFMCELCQKDEILFPFQSERRVKRCTACGSCYHFKCLRKRDCPKCKRLQLRKELASQYISEREDESDAS